MATVVEVANPFNPLDSKRREHAGGLTVRRLLASLYGADFKEFSRPTICKVQGNAVMRKDWDTLVIEPKDTVEIVALQGDITTIFYVLYYAFVAYTIYTVLTMPKPGLNGATPEPDPVYTLNGQRNQIRLGSPIEVPYGRNRLFPSYAARPYNKFANNDQFQYQLFCLGQGTYEIEAIQLEDTSIDNFADVQYEIYEPGDDVTLFPDNVVTSTEVAGIELLGPNEDDYAISGPFTANGVGTLATKLEVDVSLPQGLYHAANNGSLDNVTITALFEYREIDDSGDPVGLGTWFTLASFSKTLHTNTPQRYTLELEVDPGRYEVRGHRTNDKQTDSRYSNVLRWDQLRAFLPSTKDYGDVTLIAVAARATNNLNDQSSNRFNVIATRKIRTWDGSVWTDPVASRSIAWAFADNFQANYGGRLADAYLNLTELKALDDIYTGLGWTFDFIFDQRATCWDQARIIARCGRAVPMANGSQITMIRDYTKSVATAVFNQENIVQNSFKWDVKLIDDGDYDGLEIEYIDPDTFMPETVLCLVGADAGDNPEQMKFPGCQNRDHAYQEGMYMRASKLYLRENTTFSTGKEGHIPNYGDLIRIVHDLPRWGQGGMVNSIVDTLVTLNEPVTFGVGTHQIAFRKKDGTIQGPYTVTAGTLANEVILSGGAIDGSGFYFDNIRERPLYYFGVANDQGILATCLGLAPNDDDTVEIQATIYNETVFSFGDSVTPPKGGNKMPPPAPHAPALDCTLVSFVVDSHDRTKAVLSWAPAIGAVSYNIQTSQNGVDWDNIGSTPQFFFTIDILVGQVLQARVQPVGAAAGPWCQPTLGFGSNDGTPPPGDDNYQDFFTVITGGTITTKCKEIGGTASLVGCEAFTAPDSPPKKYRHFVQSGTNVTDSFPIPPGSCSGPASARTTCNYTGQIQWDADTGTPAATGGVACSDTLGGSSSTPQTTTCPTIPANNCLGTWTVGPTSASRAGTGVCCPHTVGVDDRKTITDTLALALSDEDTEDDAIARLMASVDGYDDISWSDCIGFPDDPCCFSTRTRRTTGFDITYQRAMVQITASGMVVVDDYVVLRVEIWRTNLDTMIDEAAETNDYEATVDMSGDASWEFELPNEEGYTYYLKSRKFLGFAP